MFTRNQLDGFYNTGDTLFASAPKELFPLIGYYQPTELFNHLAFGERTAAEALIKADPSLLIHVCSGIQTPSGLVIDYPITAFEFTLLSGDDRAAAMLKPYFSQIPDGEKYLDEQSERCRKHVENMLERQPSYNLYGLIDIIKNCTDAEITAALHHDTQNMNPAFLEEITKFRAHFTPERMTTPGMHFNYMDLLYAFEMYVNEFDNLVVGNNYDRCDLVLRQVAGFVMRGLPARDRQIFACGIFYVLRIKIEAEETFEFNYNRGNFFPSVRDVDYYTAGGFGYDTVVSNGGRLESGRYVRYAGKAQQWAGMLKTLFEQKLQTCSTLCWTSLGVSTGPA